MRQRSYPKKGSEPEAVPQEERTADEPLDLDSDVLEDIDTLLNEIAPDAAVFVSQFEQQNGE